MLFPVSHTILLSSLRTNHLTFTYKIPPISKLSSKLKKERYKYSVITFKTSPAFCVETADVQTFVYLTTRPH